jgi:hypothetical protein
MSNGNGKEQKEQPEPHPAPKKTHEEWMQLFAEKLNNILQEGFPLPAVIQVLDSAIFEMKISLYFKQIEMAEKQQQQKLIQTPTLRIPTGKIK